MSARTRPAPPPPAEAVRGMREAMAAHQRGDLARAEERYRWLTDTFPGFADAWHYYGLLHHQRGESAPALKLLRRAQALAPRHAVFLLNFGLVLTELGRYAQAIGCLARVLRLEPGNREALIAYAQALVEADRGAEATARLEQHVRGYAADWSAWTLLGRCREQANDRTGAKRAFDEAVKRAPPGDVTRHLQRLQDALDARDSVAVELAFRAALRIEPRSGAAYLRLANMAMDAGDAGRSREWAHAALARDPRLWKAWTLLATNPQEPHDEAFVQRLEQAVRDGRQDSGIAPVHFALGSVHEQRGEYDEAFAAYARGNGIQGRHRIYDRALQETYVADIIDALDETFVKRTGAVGMANSGAIFVCGMPRSGTTLVETILASHPQVAAGGEMQYVHDWLRRTIGMPHLRKTGSTLRGTNDSQLHTLARGWQVHLKRAAAGAARVTDKMPGNYHILGLIHVCFPDAAVVHVSRDPRDSGLSCFTTYFERGQFFSHDLASIAHYYRLHERLMEHWRSLLGPDRLIDIEYETLVQQPETEVRRLLAALDLPWDPSCLRFQDHRHDVRSASRIQVRQPLYRTSIGRWRRFERHLAPLLDALA